MPATTPTSAAYAELADFRQLVSEHEYDSTRRGLDALIDNVLWRGQAAQSAVQRKREALYQTLSASTARVALEWDILELAKAEVEWQIYSMLWERLSDFEAQREELSSEEYEVLGARIVAPLGRLIGQQTPLSNSPLHQLSEGTEREAAREVYRNLVHLLTASQLAAVGAEMTR